MHAPRARTGAEDLADEGIHLVSTIQLAGFWHTIRTLWSVSDKHCASIAEAVYKTLHDEGMTDEAVYCGLHRAMKELCDQAKMDVNIRSKWPVDMWKPDPQDGPDMTDMLSRLTDIPRQRTKRSTRRESPVESFQKYPVRVESDGERLRVGEIIEPEHHATIPWNWVPYVHCGV